MNHATPHPLPVALDSILCISLFLFLLLVSIAVVITIACLLLFALKSWPWFRSEWRNAVEALNIRTGKVPRGDFIAPEDRAIQSIARSKTSDVADQLF